LVLPKNQRLVIGGQWLVVTPISGQQLAVTPSNQILPNFSRTSFDDNSVIIYPFWTKYYYSNPLIEVNLMNTKS